jgi:hypothetical protein
LIAAHSTGDGEVDTTGLPIANQIAYFTAGNKIGGNAGFLFTGSTVTNGAFYTGTSNPASGTERINYNGSHWSYNYCVPTSVGSYYFNSVSAGQPRLYTNSTYLNINTDDGLNIMTNVDDTVIEIKTGATPSMTINYYLITEGYLRTNNYLQAYDSVYLSYTGTGELAWLVRTETGAIDTGQLTPANFIILNKDKIPAFRKYYKDVVNGERLWYFGIDSTGNWITSRVLPNNPTAITALQSKSEMQDEWLKQMDNKIQLLGLAVVVLCLYIVVNLIIKK